MLSFSSNYINLLRMEFMNLYTNYGEMVDFAESDEMIKN